MKHIIRQTISHPLVSGSAVIFIGSNVANVFNFLFNFLMVRNLSDADFGILTSLNSFILLPLLVATALTPIVVNFAAEYFAQKRFDLVHGFYIKIAKYYFSFSALLLLIFLLFTPAVSAFLHIQNVQLVILTGVIAFIGLITTLNAAFLQAKLAFLFISINALISAIVKMLGGILAVFLAWGVTGGMWAVFAATFSLFLFSFYPLRFIFKKNIEPSPIPTRELISYGIPSAFAILGLTAFISTDILLVKHFFNPDDAGIYASLSLVAKIIYFLTASIATVMFPVVVQKRSKGEPFLSTFLLGIALVAIPSMIITAVYFLLPEFVISIIVKKPSVIAYGSHLGIFAVFMSLYSLISLLTNFYLSLKRTVVAIPICLVALLQGGIIWLYHDSFMQVISISLWLMLLLLIGLLLYYPHATKK